MALDDAADKVRFSAEVSRSPTWKPIGAVELPIVLLVKGIDEMNGAVLAGSTFTMNEVLFERPPVSVT